jgi:glycerophosphoryl diester phosphodiesterase
MKRRRFTPLVLGHRGYRARFPENTLLAFREALRAGADGIECDLQKSADGRYVVIHDPTTERVTGVSRDVVSSRFEELRELDFGQGEGLPLLEETLKALPPSAYLDLELKEETITAADAVAIAPILDAHRSRDHLMISSFASNLLVPLRRMGFTVGLLVGEDVAARGLSGFAKVLFRLRPQFVNLPVDTFRVLGRNKAEILCRFLKAFGFSLLFWTVNTAEEVAVLAPFARILVSDEVEQIVGALKALHE